MNKIDKLFPKIEGDILKTNIVFGTPEITIYSLEDDREYYVCKDRKYLASVYEIKDVIIDQLDLTDEQISQIINTNHLIEIKKTITR